MSYSLSKIYQEIRQRPVWSLLASDDAPTTLSYLQTLLFDKEHSLTVTTFLDRLTTLMDQGSAETISPAQSRAKLNQWLKANYIHLYYVDDIVEPFVELTGDGHEAIRFISSLRNERVSPDQSQLETVYYLLNKVSTEITSDPQTRIAFHRQEIARHEHEIKMIEDGQTVVASPAQFHALLSDLLDRINQINGDFLYVRENLRSLSQDFQENTIKNDLFAKDVLKEFFSAYDAINKSKAGETFNAFYALLNNPIASVQMKEAIETLQDSDYWMTELDAKQRRDLIYLSTNLYRRAQETKKVINELVSKLNVFIQRRDFSTNQRLSELIKEVKQEALQCKENISPTERITTLHLSCADIKSIETLRLFDPETHATVEEMLVENEQSVDLGELAKRINLADINFTQLKDHICSSLMDRESVSISTILDEHPATQGLASIVGLIRLAVEHATQIIDQTEAISWKDRFGQYTFAYIPLFFFTRDCLAKIKSNSVDEDL